MNFDPVDRDFDIYSESQRPRLWSGTVRITLEHIHAEEGKNTVIECDFDIDDAHDEESVLAQIRDIIEHQTRIQIL